MKKLITLLMSSLLFGFAASAQEALFQAQNIQSPEVHDDNSVTFRLFAPNAQAVQVTGDFLPPVKMDTPMGQMDGPGKVALAKMPTEFGPIKPVSSTQNSTGIPL